MKIKSMPQLMNPQEQDREIEVFRRLSLGPRAYEEYYPYNNNTELAFTIGGQDVYVQKGYSDTTFLCFDNNDPYISDRIVFNSILRNIEPRNDMYRKNGLCQSLIVKENSLNIPNFGVNFLMKLLKEDYIDTFLASDLLQSSFGVRLWEKLLVQAKKEGYFCFYGLSAPKYPKFMVFLTSPEDAKYYSKYIVGPTTGYRTRSAVIVQKGARLKNILNYKKETDIYYVSCRQAIEMGFFSAPRDLTEDEILLFSKNIKE